jgi:serine/threonine protein kinase
VTDPQGDRWIGRRIGNYAIVHKLGAGGMGVVYEAEQASLGRRIALKVLPRTPATLPMLIERFKREARLLSTLSHPNVVTVFDAGEEADLLYFAMELVPGGDLRGVMRRQGKLAALETLPIVKDIAAALLVAHQKGIIHRDLKPENVMIVPVTGREPMAKVLDFGIARALNDNVAGQPALTAGAVIGTPTYIAPEVMLGPDTIDGRADLYALGVIWFEMLCARPPFVGNNATAVALQQVNDDAPRVSKFTPVPSIVDDCVANLLQRDPKRRPKDAQTLLSLLDDVETQLLADADTHPVKTASLANTFPTDAPTIGATSNVSASHFTLPTPMPPTHSGTAARPAPPPVAPPTPSSSTPQNRTMLYAALGSFLAVLVVVAAALVLFPPSAPSTPPAPPVPVEKQPPVAAEKPPVAVEKPPVAVETPPAPPPATTPPDEPAASTKPKAKGKTMTPATATPPATPATPATKPAGWTPDIIDDDDTGKPASKPASNPATPPKTPPVPTTTPKPPDIIDG